MRVALLAAAFLACSSPESNAPAPTPTPTTIQAPVVDAGHPDGRPAPVRVETSATRPRAPAKRAAPAPPTFYQPADRGPQCRKGCRCGRSCISCAKTCRQ